jgi:hypothetical protein
MQRFEVASYQMIDRFETLEVLQEDYPYLTDEYFDFARIFVKAYPTKGRPKLDGVHC